jgi:hypothetical protein
VRPIAACARSPCHSQLPVVDAPKTAHALPFSVPPLCSGSAAQTLWPVGIMMGPRRTGTQLGGVLYKGLLFFERLGQG